MLVMKAQAQQGNILFLILLAVVLFAALSYAVTQSLRGGGTDASGESMKTQASAIVQYANLIENTITRMRMSNNCSDTAISFINPGNTMYNSHVSTPACQVFAPEGGGLTPQAFLMPDGVRRNAFFVDGNYVQDIGTSCTTGECNELVLLMNIPNDKFCAEINNVLNVSNPNGAPPVDTDISTGIPFTGSYGAAGAQILDQTGGVLRGRHAGCLYETTGGGNTYKYYHVLIAR